MAITTLFPRALSAFRDLEDAALPACIEIESEAPPEELLGQLPERGLSIVGTRQPQRRSLEWIDAALGELRSSGLVILSGYARGIDAHAHAAAVRLGLRTLAILGCGLDIDYPRGHRGLRKQILESGGALLSSYPRGTPPYAGNFLRRNAWIAGLSRAVWVVEAAAASGTLNTAAWAVRLHRDLYATSCFPGDPRFEGNEKLLSQKQTERYAVAQAFFGAHSLGATWPGLFLAAPARLTTPEKPLLRWVLEIRLEEGECHLPALLSRAADAGIPRGRLLQELQQEMEAGRVRQSEDGGIELADALR